MVPFLRRGDWVILENFDKRSCKIVIGDIVCYREAKTMRLVAHRVIRITEKYIGRCYLVRGDCPLARPEAVESDRIVAGVRFICKRGRILDMQRLSIRWAGLLFALVSFWMPYLVIGVSKFLSHLSIGAYKYLRLRNQ